MRILPEPDMVRVSVTDSPVLSSLELKSDLISYCPTAPEKFCGCPVRGSGLTLITEVFDWIYTRFVVPKSKKLFAGTS